MFTRKKITIGLIILLSLASIIYLSYLLATSPTPPSTLPTPTPPIKFSTPITYTLASSFQLPPPTQLSVYSASVSHPDILSEAAKIASHLQLTPNPNKNIKFWSDADQSNLLYLEDHDQVITFSKDLIKHPLSKSLPLLSLSEAIRTSDDAVKSLGFTNVSPLINQISFIKVDLTHLEPSTPADYDLIYIPYAQTIANYPLLHTNTLLDYLGVTIARNKQVVKLQYSPLNFSTFTPTRTLNYSQTPSQVEKLLTDQRYTAINAKSFAQESSIYSYSSYTITHADLVYQLDISTNIASPKLLLTAFPSTKSPETIQLYLLIDL